MDINTVCTLLIEALKNAGYNESTIFNYQGAARRFTYSAKNTESLNTAMKSACFLLTL